MPITYQKFLKQKIDLSPLGMEQSAENYPYFCTPKGASIIGCAGVDGIHFCRIRGFGEMVFAVSPMNGVGEYVHPLAESFEDFLRLLLACGNTAALEQAWQWDEALFLQFLKDNPVTVEQQVILKQISDKFQLTPMEQPWRYLKRLQSSFDYSKIKFTEDYYDIDMNANAPRVAPEWKVVFEGGFWGNQRGRAGKEIVVNKQFTWAGYEWQIPAVYVCGKGIVIDFCIKVEPERMQAFRKKWDLTTETESYRRYTKEEEMLMEAENPVGFDFMSKVQVNGTELHSTHGYGVYYNPCMSDDSVMEEEGKWLTERYGLDMSAIWVFRRTSFPWATAKKPELKTLSVVMEQQKVTIPGARFRVEKPGDTVTFTHPENGVEYMLTVQEYEKKELDMERMFSKDMEYPTHYYQMAYTITPEPERSTMTISDCAEGDSPRQKKYDASAPYAASSIGIIGGADGPTALFVGGSAQKNVRVACSSLHFEPVEEVEWSIMFHEKRYADECFKLM